MSDRTVHAETAYAEIVRYERAGIWYVEDTPNSATPTCRTRMRLRHVVEWVTEQPQNEVTYHFGRQGGRLFDSYVKAELERVRS
jgi:hypothetical protein